MITIFGLLLLCVIVTGGVYLYLKIERLNQEILAQSAGAQKDVGGNEN